jgi:HK97 family phage major capsid protein/HK97 family phage prohead protease
MMAKYKGEDIDLTPTEAMAEEAQKGLDWRKEFGRGGTEVGVARARQLINRQEVSAETVRRMHSYFSRHEVDKEGEGFSPGEDGYPSAGRIAWALWGGDVGQSWARNKDRQLDKIDEDKREYEQYVRPYPNEHSARLTNPDKYDIFRREKDAGGKGIDFIYGINDQGSEIQAIRFDEKEFTEEEAKQWLKDNDFDYILFEAALKERGAKMENRHVVDVQETEDTVTVVFEKHHAEPSEEMTEEKMGHEEEEKMEHEDERKEPITLDYRAMHLDDKAIDEETRTVRVGVSSEEPVKRQFGMEVMDHTKENMNLEFLNSGRAPLLLDHDMEKQIGVVESVELDENARRLRASVRFGKGEQASEVFNDVVDGIRQNISVGYRVDKKVEREDDPEDYYRVATTPMEISIVSIPADQSNLVGVGRSSSETLKSTIQIKEKDMSEKIDLDAVRAEAAKSASKNAKEIMTLARKHNKADLGEDAIGRGIDIAEFRGELLDVIGNDKPLDTPVTVIEQSAKEKRTYSLGRMIQAQVTGDWKNAGYERELSDEITRRTGKQSQGFYVPDFAWRSGVMTTAATGAIAGENVTDQFVPTIQRGDLFIEALRAKQVMANLGVTYLGGLTNRVRMPKIATGAAAGFVEEAGDVSDQSPTDAGVTLQPRTLGAFATMSRLLMLESVPAIEQIVQDDLLRSIADKIEYYAINGSGSSGQPTGILTDANVNNLDISAGTDVAALTWADITDLVKLVEEDNGVVNAATLGFLTNPKVKAKMANTVKVATTDSVMLLNDPWNAIYGYKAEFTNNVPSDLDPGDGGSDASAMIFGDFSQLMVGLFGAPSIIVDPYSGSKSGDVQISVMQEVDVALRNAISFAKTDEISTA